MEKSPEQLKEELAAKETARLAREKYLSEVKTALNAASEDVNLKIVLRHIMNLAGYNANPVVVGTSGEVSVSSTVYNGGRESVYHDLRKLMSADTKNAVERSE